ncbi:phage replisome organizer N-terminal domain-containing protein [Clostridium saccharoperbutylacetonicum]|uniref:phage replisome organizer N-terminal domain-containing protein n=1 Tax=Clostridium saccharoperbutylacetonicum TaxID=36745 RepID=UPI0039E85BF8
MRERKYVKLRVDMPDDTKFKMIDRMPERDIIQYIWFRLVLLAGKVNLMGELYLSKNIPYSIETLAIEVNREEKDIKLALDTFIKLEMVELTGNKVYRIKNFAKHQNINMDYKVETNKCEDKNTKKVNENDEFKKEDNLEYIDTNEKKNLKVEDNINVRNEKVIDLEINDEKNGGDMEKQPRENENKYDINIGLENKKPRKSKSRRKNDTISDFEDNTDEEVYEFVSGDIENTLKKGERIVGVWKF